MASLQSNESEARLLVFSSLFPSAAAPTAGIFIKERMTRVARKMPLVFVCPQPWFPFQSLLRLWKPSFRPMAAYRDAIGGTPVFRPRFLSVPGFFKSADGLLLALSTYFLVRRLVRDYNVDLLDVHFAYPDGFGGAKLAQWLGLPFVVTLRGKEERQAATALRRCLAHSVKSAAHVITVSERLAELAMQLGACARKVTVIGNGVDLARFSPVSRDEARQALGIAPGAKVMVSVGGLVERKGFHRVIDCIPALKARFPELLLLIAGGAGPEGGMEAELRAQVNRLGLHDNVRFLGVLRGEELTRAYSAADIFVLATRYEGWANVFLEAMACGLPVVSTLVGGNAEVVQSSSVGQLVAFGDQSALTRAIETALVREWDRQAIRRYAEQNTWDRRVEQVVAVFDGVLQPGTTKSFLGSRPAARRV